MKHAFITTFKGEDNLIWKKIIPGELNFKDAYLFNTHAAQVILWAKQIWNQFIRPLKSLLSWRLMYNKVPIDENLSTCGYTLVSW